MNLLLVEDDESFLPIFEDEINKIGAGIKLVIARSRDSAISELEKDTYDLVICDLHIPTEDSALDHSTEHGKKVITEINSKYSGTPIIVLSAYSTVDTMEELIVIAERYDIFGKNQSYPMIQSKQKSKLHECFDQIRKFMEDAQFLYNIEIENDLTKPLIKEHEKLLRIFSRQFNGAHIKIKDLPGGLSGNRTIMVDLSDNKNCITARAVVKLGKISDISDEDNRYGRVIVPLLEIGKYAPKINLIRAGAGSYGAIVYRRTDGYDSSLFDLIKNNPLAVIKVIERIKQIEVPWIESSNNNFQMLNIREIREWFLEDTSIIESKFAKRDWKSFETQQVKCRIGNQHGDLHPGNILINTSNVPVLIDYGRARNDVSMIMDPISLELSILFHPSVKGIFGDWPTEENISQWNNIDYYIKGCPIADYIRVCRDWSNSIFSDPRELNAIAYGYLIRQLKFEDINLELAKSLLCAVIDSYNK